MSYQYIKPSFFILGGVKCGTSSLYRYINEHPAVLPCKTKEPLFFLGKNFVKWWWKRKQYFSLFPERGKEGWVEADWLEIGDDEKMKSDRFRKMKKSGQEYITGEASAITLHATHPPSLKMILPNLKFIVLVRNPTDRYFSHFRMYERFHKEGKPGYDYPPLGEYVEQEISNFRQGKNTRLLKQGLYQSHIEKWEKTYGSEKIIVLPTRDFKQIETAQNRMSELCSFLGLMNHDFSEILKKKFNKASLDVMDENIKKTLDDFYAPYNRSFFDKYEINLKR